MPKDRRDRRPRSLFSSSDVTTPGGARAPIAKLLAALGEGACQLVTSMGEFATRCVSGRTWQNVAASGAPSKALRRAHRVHYLVSP